MPRIELPPLPFSEAALTPVISKATIEKHYGKHHKSYVEKTNALTEGGPLEGADLETIIKTAAADERQKALFNNAAQVYNHNLYWQSLSPDGSKPSSALSAQIEADFGSLDALKDQLVKRGTAHFASGWVWLVWGDNKTVVLETHDADTCLLHGKAPLLVIDVWEHAYYVDYQNERERHLKTLVHEALNWKGASDRFAAASR